MVLLLILDNLPNNSMLSPHLFLNNSPINNSFILNKIGIITKEGGQEVTGFQGNHVLSVDELITLLISAITRIKHPIKHLHLLLLTKHLHHLLLFQYRIQLVFYLGGPHLGCILKPFLCINKVLILGLEDHLLRVNLIHYSGLMGNLVSLPLLVLVLLLLLLRHILLEFVICLDYLLVRIWHA